MKKKFTAVAVFLTAAFTTVVILLASCMGTNGVLSGVDTTSALGNIIGSVLGVNRVSEANLVGTWKYTAPGCAFTSDNLLAKAGGEVAAAEVKSKLQPYFQQIGINSQNTVVTFNQDGTFAASFRGTNMSGKWTFDAKTYKVNLQGMLLSINCYAKRNANGVGLLFEGKKLLTVLQTVAAMSGNSNIQAVGEISKSYDGLRIGFDYTR